MPSPRTVVAEMLIKYYKVCWHNTKLGTKDTLLFLYTINIVESLFMKTELTDLW